MCTLTIVHAGNQSVRIAFNRDERPTRPEAIPPQLRQFGSCKALLPTDPESGGTWLAVNDSGLVLAVLNVTAALSGTGAARAVPLRSRGTIIPSLLDCDSPSAALASAERLFDYSNFAPFRLVMIGHGVAADVRWDGREAMVMSRLMGSTPLLFTSSGLGDHLVEGVRRELFTELFSESPETWLAAQATFHRHVWPGREHLSVNMTRATARTVSFSIIDLTADEATFAYRPGPPDGTAEFTTARLPLQPGATT
jgi:hypothetical protein